MDAWADIRLIARRCHEEALAAAGGDRRAQPLIQAALKNDDLEVHRFEPGIEAGVGVLGWLDRSGPLVNIARGQNPADEAVVIAHEIGHFRLHKDPSNEVTSVHHGLGGDTIDSGAGRVEGYSPHERKEVQADVFAGEFLCPADWLRGELLVPNRKPSQIASVLGLPAGIVLNQAIRALLLPPLRAPEGEEDDGPVGLDESQNLAATWDDGSVLVDAGPGTGKTRTLVHRIGHVLDSGELSGSILALTFSNKAAEEMRVRLAGTHGDAAVEMWIGTFHAFGLEMVRKWAGRLGRTVNVKIYDDTLSLALLEKRLHELPLRHFQNLYEPAYDLVHVLRAISRCKDELVSPEEYLAQAQAALAVATSDEEREAAEKALEVGRVYEIYQQALKDDDAVDFGDLVMLPIELMAHPDIAESHQARFKHLLVDEYQDVNLASAQLLISLAGDCRDVWVVADQRQSIYRFRGAAPANVSRFAEEFGGKRLSLNTNYRSGGPVVRAFSQFTSHMTTDPGALASWQADRGEVGEVSVIVMPTVAAEAAAIRDRIEELRASGVAYRDQAILARSHLTLSRITGPLEQLGVPMLYLGDLFERDEIRDLLSLVALDAEFGGIGLVRVGQLPEYGASREDTLTVLRWAHDHERTIFEALSRTGEIAGLSRDGAAGLARLGCQLAGMGPGTTPWTLLSTWLFERSAYLQPMLEKGDAKSQQQLIAIYHLLKVCSEQMAMGDTSRKRFLDRIRRIEALNQDTMYRAVSSEATDFDAVRVMTIHGSKGLEFRAVHVPALATAYLPTSRQGNRCPPPPGLPALGMQAQDHDAEEECLFFVALSRARDFLCLSRAERYTAKRNSSESKFLKQIAGRVSARQVGPVTEPVAPERACRPQAPCESYPERDLDLYLRCPARYHYERLDGLEGSRDASAYLRFHRCVYRTIGWLEQRATEGSPASRPDALAQLSRQWELAGPKDHAFQSYYLAAAQEMVGQMADVIRAERADYDRTEWRVPIDGRVVTVTPDRVLLNEDGTVSIQRIRTGRQSKSEPDHRIYALLRRGAAERFPDKPLFVGTFYPASGDAVPARMKNDDKLFGEYREAIAGIERGDFKPEPKDRRLCPNCQCYLICGV